MADRVVEFGGFQDEPSAWLARANLAANGIRAAVIAGQNYGLGPPLIRLAVLEQEVDVARRILAATSDGPSA